MIFVFVCVLGEDLRAQLLAQVEATTLAAWAPNTRKNYSLHRRTFFTYCRMFWRARDHLLLSGFAQFLSWEFRSPRAVENYFTGVKWHYIFNDYDVGVFKHPALRLFMRGLARLMQHFPKQAAP